MQIIQDTVAGLEVGAPVVHRQMAMFPLLGKQAGGGERAYLTLDEALTAASAQVGEVSEGGSVPELLLRNLGDKPVLLVEGEELVGAKQNRTLNISILAPPKQDTPIPVTCVEAGRWGYGDDVVFQRSDRAHYARGRRTKREAVNRSMSHDPGSRAADQGAVWEDIDAKMAAMSARSDTGAMGDIYEQNRRSLDDFVAAFGQQPGQVGAVFMVGTTFAGVDLFAHEATFGGLLPKLAAQLRARRAGGGRQDAVRASRGNCAGAAGRRGRGAGAGVSGGRVGPGRAHREPNGRRRGAVWRATPACCTWRRFAATRRTGRSGRAVIAAPASAARDVCGGH